MLRICATDVELEADNVFIRTYIYLMRTLIFIVVFLLGAQYAKAQKSVKDILGAMPESVVPYLNAEQLAELGKFTDGENSASVKNALNGTTSVDTLSHDFAVLRLNSVTDMQVRLLPLGDTAQVVCVIKTVNKPVAESSINFYTTDWKRLDSSFNLPASGDAGLMIQMLTQRPDTMPESKFGDLCKNIEPVIVSADFSNYEKGLTYSLSLPFVQNADIKEVKSITKQKTFKWNADSFKEY